MEQLKATVASENIEWMACVLQILSGLCIYTDDIKRSHILLCKGNQTRRSSNVWFTLHEALEHAKLNYGNRNHQGASSGGREGVEKGQGNTFS